MVASGHRAPGRDSVVKELKRLIRPDELAKALGVAQVTVYSWCRRGLIPHHRLEGVIRFDPDEIDEWLKERRVPARKIHGDLMAATNKELNNTVISVLKETPAGADRRGKGGQHASNFQKKSKSN
jgi:excisionase family DNA binding protein